MKTFQELFDSALRGIRAQGGRCYDGDQGRCMYKFGTTKCAIGHSIADEDYDSLLDLSGTTELQEKLRVRYPRLAAGGCVKTYHFSYALAAGTDGLVPKDYNRFMGDLQIAHDNASEMDEFEENMRGLAKDYELQYA